MPISCPLLWPKLPVHTTNASCDAVDLATEAFFSDLGHEMEAEPFVSHRVVSGGERQNLSIGTRDLLAILRALEGLCVTRLPPAFVGRTGVGIALPNGRSLPFSLVQSCDFGIGQARHLLTHDLKENQRSLPVYDMFFGRPVPGLPKGGAGRSDLHSITGEKCQGDLVDDV